MKKPIAPKRPLRFIKVRKGELLLLRIGGKQIAVRISLPRTTP